MTKIINTEAKDLLQDVDFSHEGAHLAYTLGAGAASFMNDAYLFKAGNTDLNREDKEKALVLAKGVTYNNKRKLIEAALESAYPQNEGDYGCIWVDDFSDEYCIYDGRDCLDYKHAYAIIGDQVTLIGSPIQVVRQTEWVEVGKSTATSVKEIPLEKGKMPEISGKNDSDAILESVDKTADSGINQDKKDTMPDKKEETVDKSLDLETLQKSMEEMTTLLKASEAKAKAAEDKAEAVEKAAELERKEKAKSDLIEVVKAWDSVENTDEVVEALLKSSGSSVIIAAMETLHKKVEEVKKNFGETEHGADGDLIVKSSTDSAKEATAKILKARKEARSTK